MAHYLNESPMGSAAWILQPGNDQHFWKKILMNPDEFCNLAKATTFEEKVTMEKSQIQLIMRMEDHYINESPVDSPRCWLDFATWQSQL